MQCNCVRSSPQRLTSAALQRLLRIKPAEYGEVVEAARAGWGVEASAAQPQALSLLCCICTGLAWLGCTLVPQADRLPCAAAGLHTCNALRNAAPCQTLLYPSCHAPAMRPLPAAAARHALRLPFHRHSAAAACHTLQELVGPENLEDVAAAARDAGRPIGVHLYLFRHYGDAWGWEPDSAAQLQVRSLPAASSRCSPRWRTAQVP